LTAYGKVLAARRVCGLTGITDEDLINVKDFGCGGGAATLTMTVRASWLNQPVGLVLRTACDADVVRKLLYSLIMALRY
jgi:hypothetical protein